MAQKIYDITPKISPRLAVFPGDQAFERQVAMSFKDGHHLDLSSIRTTVHLGAHADAPSHYHAKGVSIDRRPLGPYLGKCQVIHVKGLKRGERVMPQHVTTTIKAPRVLIGTGSFPDPEKWNEDFCSLSPELITSLSDKGVRLVGIDTPSVDPHDSKKLESHQLLFERNFSVLEGLVLDGVPDGLYTLIALPLPIEGCDASPVRAVLMPHLDIPELE